MVEFCYVCVDPTGDKWIGCCLCPKWCHVKCAHLSGIKSENIPKINWICNPCLHKASLATKIVEKIKEFKLELSKEISEVKQEVESRAVSVKEELGEVADALQRGEHVESADATWAEVIKRKRKVKKRRIYLLSRPLHRKRRQQT